MNRTIFKYPIPTLGEFAISMPRGAEIVLVEYQDGQPMMWAIVREAGNEVRQFAIVGTGHPIPMNYEHIASFQAPPFVWHLFEVKQ